MGTYGRLNLVVRCLAALLTLHTCLASRQLRDVSSRPLIYDTTRIPTSGGHSVLKLNPNAAFTVDPFLLVGGATGEKIFFWDPLHGGLLERIDVWVGDVSVLGVSVKFTSGEGQSWGSSVGTPKSLVLEPGETITNASMWDNGLPEPQTRFGAMRLVTDRGQAFEAGVPAQQRGPEHPLGLGSGFVIGIAGNSASDVGAFGLCFLRKISSAVLQVLEYPTLQALSPAGGKMEAVLAYVTYNNYGDSPQLVRMAGSPSVTASHSWIFDASEKLGVPVAIRGGVPRVVDADGIPTNWTVSRTATWSAKTLEQVQREYDLPLTVQPQTSVEAKATLARLYINVDFKGKVLVTVSNKAVWPYFTEGRYEGLAYAVNVTLGKNGTTAESQASAKTTNPVIIT